MSTCDCFTGTEGDRNYKPSGSVKPLHGLNVYQTLAAAPAKAELLFLPDAFGLAIHNQILADAYAASGWYSTSSPRAELSTDTRGTEQGYNTTIVDYYEGDALPEIIMSHPPGTDLDSNNDLSPEEKEIIRKTDMAAWGSRHPEPKISGLLQQFLAEFRKLIAPSTQLHVVGHCFGGKYALRLARSDEITSAIAMHPSLVQEEDWQNLQRPVFVGCAESDVFAPTLITDTFKAAANWKVYYKISVYGGTVHGFASRADRSKSTEMRPFRSSFEDTLSWMKLVDAP